MKKTLKILLIIFTLIIASTIGINVNGATTGGSSYFVTDTVERKSIAIGVSHSKSIGITQVGLTQGGYEEYNQVVNVLDVRSTSDARIFSFANLKNHKWTKTTIADLAIQFEQENPNWRVLAGVNGDFYDINGKANFPYQTSNAHVTNGEFYKTFSGLTVGFMNDKSKNTMIGGVPTKTPNMILAVYDQDDNIIKEFDINNLNVAPSANQTSVYFGTYNSEQLYVPINVTVGDANGFVVENADYALPNRDNDFYGKGTISSTSVSTINKGQFAIVTKNTEVANALAVGVKIRAQYEFTGAFANVTDTVGSNGQFLKNGEHIKVSDSGSNLFSRHPRTMVGMKANGSIVLAVVDGRQAPSMAGVTDTEMAAIMKTHDCIEAYNLDGGGSSSMIVREGNKFVVKNSPSDNYNRPVSNALLIAVPVPKMETEIIQGLDSIQFSATILDNNGLDIQELLIEMDGVAKAFEDGKVEFTNLSSNTDYNYKFKFKDSVGRQNDLFIDGQIKTLKSCPQIISLNVSEQNDTYDLEIIYNDPDLASNLGIAKIVINETEYQFIDGKLTLTKDQIGDLISAVTIIYSYDINDGAQEIQVNFNQFNLVSSIELEVISFILLNQEQLINQIYK